jgi:chromosome segregation ATPase
MSDGLILAALARPQATLARVETTLAQVEAGQTAALAHVEAGHASLRRDMATREDLTRMREELTRTRVDIMDRIDRLQNTVSAIRDDIAVNMGAADAAQRVNDNTREDLRSLREQVSVMWRQLKAVEARVREITGDP